MKSYTPTKQRLLTDLLPFSAAGASLLANGQLNGSGSKSGHKDDDGSLHSQGLDGGKYGEDGPAKKRWGTLVLIMLQFVLSSGLSVIIRYKNYISSLNID